MDIPWKIEMLGSLRVTRGDRTVTGFRSRKAALLLSYLSLYPRPQPRELLIELLWPESSPAAGRRNLRVELTWLRHQLEPPDVSPGAVVAADNASVGLNARTVKTDVARFRAALRAARQAGNDTEQAQRLGEAVALYRGELLPGYYEPWILSERQYLAEQYFQALGQLVARLERKGEYQRALLYAGRGLTLDPLREEVHRDLMRLYAATGQSRAALRQYRELEQRLKEELGTSPAARSRALAGEIERREARPSNLPAQRFPLVGREKEAAALVEILRREPGTREAGGGLLTLTGPGGSGKTRLALHVAAQLRDDFADGVFLVELAPIADPALIASTIAQAVGIREEGGRPLLETLKDALRDRQMLLVLDNFEHLLAGAPLVSELLAHCPLLKVLVTSRAVLHLHDEQEWVVSPLAVPPVAPSSRSAKSPSFRSALLQYAAVELFVQRARKVQPGFALTRENAGAVAEICCRLDGLPLAIELAAARLKLFPPQALLARLKNPLRFLTGGSRDVPARQQTLRDTIAWSYDLLNEAEQRLFRRVSVFVGGCTLESAEAICGAIGCQPSAVSEGWLASTESREPAAGDLSLEVLDGVTSLVDKSLLQRQVSAGCEAEPRFTMLETIGEYGRERLVESGEAEAVRREHAQFFLAWAEAGVGFERLEEEHGNLRTALGWMLGAGEAAMGLRLAVALRQFWNDRGHLSEGREQVVRLLALPSAGEDAALRANALDAAGRLARSQGDHAAARVLLEEGLTIQLARGDKAGAAHGYLQLGLLARELPADYELARSLYERSLTVYRELDNQKGIALALSNLGYTAYLQGDCQVAWTLLHESLAIQREVGDRIGIGWTVTHLAEVADSLGDAKVAAACLEEGFLIWHELGDKYAIAWTLRKQGRVEQHGGRWKAATQRFAESLALCRDVQTPRGAAECLEGLAEVAAEQECSERACRLFGAAEALRERGGWPLAPAYRADQEQGVAAAQARLGAERFAAAWADGRAMSFEQAARYALQGLPDNQVTKLSTR